jgi:hypothetical protein
MIIQAVKSLLPIVLISTFCPVRKIMIRSKMNSQLSGFQVLKLVPNPEVTRDVLLDAIKEITLSNATLTVNYSRNI